jgi:hypothetical protein
LYCAGIPGGGCGIGGCGALGCGTVEYCGADGTPEDGVLDGRLG